MSTDQEKVELVRELTLRTLAEQDRWLEKMLRVNNLLPDLLPPTRWQVFRLRLLRYLYNLWEGLKAFGRSIVGREACPPEDWD